ncbi:MAG: thiol-disulfide isomerase [Pirellulaceae bacterium]|nr:thiol-disulfide isomerase [Pirellulaceae bacterium]
MGCILALLSLSALDADVVVVLGVQCPLAGLYAERLNELAERYPAVRFRAVDPCPQDRPEQIAAFARRLSFPLVRDEAGEARRLGATRSPEVFLLVGGKIAYSGRIDDQYAPGTNRAAPTRRDLEEAIREVLAGKGVSIPHATATGCKLKLAAGQPSADPSVTFAEVAPILHRRCAACHRPGQIGPFSLVTYRDTVGWTPMMREVIENGRMPPWHADPKHGTFANDRSLTSAEKQTLLAWIDAGAPRGNAEPPPPTFAEGWRIRADRVLTMPRPFAVPAEGVLDYQEFELDPGFAGDTWIQAVEIRPGSPAVVHHINVYLRPPGGERDTVYLNNVGDHYLAMTVPGNTVTDWPPGVAKVVPAGWKIVLSVHYQPNGTPQQDQSSLALALADPRTVRQQAATRLILDDELRIPPREQTTVRHEWTTEDDFTLLALYPHMHLRGKSMLFEAIDASGRVEILLDVPRYDFAWQHRYVLAVPKPLPRGTTLRCTAVYDNTAANPNNPDPSATVRAGRQSTDEMFQAGFEVVRTAENRLAADSSAWLSTPIVLAAVLLLLHWRGKPRSVVPPPSRALRGRGSEASRGP